MNGKLTLEEAKAQRRCRVCGDPVGDGRTAWTYNFGKEYAHTACLHPSQVADIHISKEHPMSDPNPEPLVKWPEERQETYAELRPHELFVFVDHPQVVLRRLERCGAVVVFGADQFDSYEPAAYASDRKVRRVKVLAMPQFEVI
jgi:hypothetical protein